MPTNDRSQPSNLYGERGKKQQQQTQKPRKGEFISRERTNAHTNTLSECTESRAQP